MLFAHTGRSVPAQDPVRATSVVGARGRVARFAEQAEHHARHRHTPDELKQPVRLS